MSDDMQYDFTIQSLGECTIPSPVSVSYFTSNEKRILFNIYLNQYNRLKSLDGNPLSVEVAGPRRRFFSILPKPNGYHHLWRTLSGINDVIRALVMELHHRYGLKISSE